MHGSPVPVSDFLSNLNDQLSTAARIVGRSKHRQAIFRIVYSGPKQIKTIEEISRLFEKSSVKRKKSVWRIQEEKGVRYSIQSHTRDGERQEKVGAPSNKNIA